MISNIFKTPPQIRPPMTGRIDVPTTRAPRKVVDAAALRLERARGAARDTAPAGATGTRLLRVPDPRLMRRRNRTMCPNLGMPGLKIATYCSAVPGAKFYN